MTLASARTGGSFPDAGSGRLISLRPATDRWLPGQEAISSSSGSKITKELLFADLRAAKDIAQDRFLLPVLIMADGNREVKLIVPDLSPMPFRFCRRNASLFFVGGPPAQE